MAKKKKHKPWEKSKEIRTIKNLTAILNSPNMKEAYKSLHPNASDGTAGSQAQRMITPELMQKLRDILQIDPKIRTTRFTIERFLYTMLAEYYAGKIKPGDALRAIEILAKLVPDFKERAVIEDWTKVKEEDVDKRLRDLGVNPSDLNSDALGN